MEPDADDAIAQISFYLLKEKTLAADAIDPESGLEAKRHYQAFDFRIDDADCHFVYFETKNPKASPPWLDFMNGQLGEGAIKFASTSESPNGLLFISLEGRTLVAVFGRSATSCLRRKALELDFGIKAAMNMCGNEEIRQTRTQANTIATTQIARQVSRPSEAYVFGLSEAEDLKFISAHMKGDPSVTLQGRDSLTVKVVGEEKLTWSRLIERGRHFIHGYAKRDYIDLFPSYKNFLPVDEDTSTKLDAVLVEKIQREDFEEIGFAIPDFLYDDKFSFTYTNHKSKDNIVYSHILIDHLRIIFDIRDVDLEDLRSKKVYAYSLEDDRVLNSTRWSVYDCIVFEHEVDDKYYILSDGNWSQVDDSFYAAIMKFKDERLRIEPCEDIYKGISIADDVLMKNREAIFNEEACKRRPQSVMFDRAKLRIGNGRKDKEFCDILDYTDDAHVRIVHCKPMKGGASSINYLFSQAKFYCDAFLQDDNLLADIREHITGSVSTSRDALLGYIGASIEDVRGDNFTVCLWLLYDQREAVPTKDTLPLISLYELKLTHDHLRRICKFRDVILRFVPVEIHNYSKAKKPKPAKVKALVA